MSPLKKSVPYVAVAKDKDGGVIYRAPYTIPHVREHLGYINDAAIDALVQAGITWHTVEIQTDAGAVVDIIPEGYVP